MAATGPATAISSASAASSTAAVAAMSNDGGGMARGANYFFGFLITFVALLLIFVGCGVGTRRRARNRGAAFMLDWSVPNVAPLEPRFYEGYLEKPHGEHVWADVMPVSATILRPQADEPASSSTSGPPPPPPRSPWRTWLDRVRRRPPHRSASSEARHSEDADRKASQRRPATPPPADETMQITMMIAMPAPPRHPNDTTPDDERPLDEYQLGVLQAPWRSPLPPSPPPPRQSTGASS